VDLLAFLTLTVTGFLSSAECRSYAFVPPSCAGSRQSSAAPSNKVCRPPRSLHRWCSHSSSTPRSTARPDAGTPHPWRVFSGRPPTLKLDRSPVTRLRDTAGELECKTPMVAGAPARNRPPGLRRADKPARGLPVDAERGEQLAAESRCAHRRPVNQAVRSTRGPMLYLGGNGNVPGRVMMFRGGCVVCDTVGPMGCGAWRRPRLQRVWNVPGGGALAKHRAIDRGRPVG